MFVQCFLPGGKCFSPGSFFQPVLPACASACEAQVKCQPQRSTLWYLQCLVLRQSPRLALADVASGNQGNVTFRCALPIPDRPFSYRILYLSLELCNHSHRKQIAVMSVSRKLCIYECYLGREHNDKGIKLYLKPIYTGT